MSLAAGSFSGRVGRVIAPMSGLSGDVIRRSAMNIAVGGRGLGMSTCEAANITSSLVTGITSMYKTSATISAGATIGTTAVSAFCPPPTSPAVAVPPAPAAAQQPPPTIVYVPQQQPLQQYQQPQQQQKSFLQENPNALLYGGGALALAFAAWLLLK